MCQENRMKEWTHEHHGTSRRLNGELKPSLGHSCTSSLGMSANLCGLSSSVGFTNRQHMFECRGLLRSLVAKKDATKTPKKLPPYSICEVPSPQPDQLYKGGEIHGLGFRSELSRPTRVLSPGSEDEASLWWAAKTVACHSAPGFPGLKLRLDSTCVYLPICMYVYIYTHIYMYSV